MFNTRRSRAGSHETMELDWQGAGYDRMPKFDERPHTPTRLVQHHQRAASEDQRRPSVTQLPSRSNTYNSHDISPGSETVSRPSLDTIPPRNSTYRRSLSQNTETRGEKSESIGRSLMKKGSKLLLRRQNSHQNLTSLKTLDWSEELDDRPYPQKPEASAWHQAAHARTHSIERESSARLNISRPFNFRHLTHTDPVQFQKMKEVNPNDIISEFSAIRASQAPHRELRGIRAKDIPRQNLSARSSSYNSSSTWRSSQTSSRPMTPLLPRDLSPTNPQFQSPSNHMPSPSIDSLAQVSLITQEGPVSPLTPLSRNSSHYFPPDCFREESPTENEFEPSVRGEDDEPFDYPIATWNSGVYDFTTPHAVSTPGDAAYVLPPPFQMVRTELTQVLEEDEVSDGWRNSVGTMTLRSPPSLPVSRDSQPLRSARQDSQQWPQPVDEALSETKQFPKPRRNSRQIIEASIEDSVDDIPYQSPPKYSPIIGKDSEGNWEELVDWCYEHAAEADSNFDFTKASLVDSAVSPWWAQRPRPSKISSPGPSPLTCRRSSSVYSSPPSPLRQEMLLPDLEPSSAVSGQSSFDESTEAITPTQSLTDQSAPLCANDSKVGFAKPASNPSLFMNDLIPQEVYDDLCQDDMYTSQSVIDPHNQFHFGHVDGSTISTSPRSSRTLLSKSSSFESFWARQHSNSNSAGSLPELVHSKAGWERRDSATDQPAEPFPLLATHEIAIDSLQTVPSSRRTPSLVKDVAQKNLLSRVLISNGIVDDATNAEVPLPLHPALRDRAGSDAAFRDPEPFVPPPFARPGAHRMRSASSSSSLKSMAAAKTSRTSYGLFPKAPLR